MRGQDVCPDAVPRPRDGDEAVVHLAHGETTRESAPRNGAAVNPSVLLALLVTILLADTVLRVVARRLQLRHQPSRPPPELADRLDPARYAQGRAYARDTVRVSDAHDALHAALWLALLLGGTLGAWHAAVAGTVAHDWLATALFLASVAIAFDVLGLPFAAYRTFVIEARYGFNTSSAAQFVRDRVTGYLLTIVLGGGLLALLLWSLERWGASFWVPYAVLAGLVLTSISVFYTSLLLPLFNRLTPLPEGPLADAIRRYVDGAGFALDDTYVMDGSKRSTKANAFFSGLGRTRKVVLFDTLLERHPVDEVVAVVAHEVAHARLRHGPTLLLTSLASITLLLFLLSRVVESSALSLALGGSEHALGLNLVAFALLVAPVSLALDVATNALSRRFEYQADAFAAHGVGAPSLQAALKRLTSDALVAPTHHPLYALLHASHPSTVERLRALERLR